MTTDPQAILSRPFLDAEVGLLPRVTCSDCSQNRGQCSAHRRQKCNVCSAFVSTQHIHLSYVGHAEVTERLLEADPSWSWEPVALDQRGLPAFDEFGGLWIRLTVAGVTRLGYGDAVGKPKGPNAVKEAIGDALRNAAMRFGVALNLWAKTDLAANKADREAPVGFPEHPASADAVVSDEQAGWGGQMREADPTAVAVNADTASAWVDEWRKQLDGVTAISALSRMGASIGKAQREQTITDETADLLRQEYRHKQEEMTSSKATAESGAA